MIVMATACFALLDGTAKSLAAMWPVIWVAWARYTAQGLLMAVVLGPLRGRRLWHTRSPGRQGVRALFLLLTTLAVVTALQRMPLAETTAVVFTAPLFVVLLSRRILGETVGVRRWIATALGFAGALVVTRPGGGLTADGVLLAGFGALSLALYQVMTRQLSHQEDPFVMLFWNALVGTALLTPVLPWVGTPDPINLGTMGQVLGLGLSAGLGHFLLIRAFREAPASLLSPVSYLQILAAAGVGWLFFGQLPDVTSFLGMTVIILAGALLAWDGRKPA
ncbi:MAG: EamA family transporter [Zoogloeaceae bacterium]|nr:EamA family transporter [Zoogloeaceae bacterium]